MKGWVDFRAVKQAVTMEGVLRHYQVTGLRRHREQLEGACPIHRGKRDDSFRASLSKNVFHCFACQASGNVLDFVAAMERCSIREAALRLQQWFGGSTAVEFQVASWHAVQPKGELVREKQGGNPPLRFALTGVDPSHPYLVQRGIDRVTADEFGVGFYARPGLLRERMVIPIRNERGHIVASMTKAGKITRVSCPICGSRVPYKSGTTRRASNKVGAPYDRARTYRRGQTIMHPTFGEGEVTAIIESGKMDVLFADRMRRLIHSV